MVLKCVRDETGVQRAYNSHELSFNPLHTLHALVKHPALPCMRDACCAALPAP